MFRGKWVLVTGAGSGIGRATASAFAAHGAHLILVDMDEPRLQSTALALRAEAVRVLSFVADVTDRQRVIDLFEELRPVVPALDVLVNNAGKLVAGGYQTTLDDFESVLKANLLAAVHMTQLFVPAMQRARRGAVVNVASAAGLVGFSMLTAYSTSKFALVGFSAALDAELEPDGISVSWICPGLVRSNFSEKLPLDPAERVQLDSTLERHGMHPDEVAAAIVRAVAQRNRFVAVGSQARFLAWLARLAPSRASRLLASLARRAQSRLPNPRGEGSVD